MTHEFKLMNVQLPYELPCKFHANPHLIIIPCQFTPISLTSKFNLNSKGTIKWISSIRTIQVHIAIKIKLVI